MDFQQGFYDKFELNGVQNCTFSPGEIMPDVKDICPFEVSWEAGEGPFLTANYSFFIPIDFY